MRRRLRLPRQPLRCAVCAVRARPHRPRSRGCSGRRQSAWPPRPSTWHRPFTRFSNTLALGMRLPDLFIQEQGLLRLLAGEAVPAL